MATLTERIERLQSSVSIPAVIMGDNALLPGQQMKLKVTSKPFAELLLELQAGGGTLAIMVLTEKRALSPFGVQVGIETVKDQGDGTWRASLMGQDIVQFLGALEESDYDKGGETGGRPEGIEAKQVAARECCGAAGC